MLSDNGKSNQLRVDLTDFDGVSKYATYDNFAVAGEAKKYVIQLGKYGGKKIEIPLEIPFRYFSYTSLLRSGFIIGLMVHARGLSSK